MIESLAQYTLPAAYALLPPAMASSAASALLLAIALQESGGTYRRQRAGGPARSFWMFERNGLVGLFMHDRSRTHLMQTMTALRYGPTTPINDAVRVCHAAVEHNDTLACAAARLLLWTLPTPLPLKHEPAIAYGQYLAAWKPGIPRPATWDAHYATAWQLVDAGPDGLAG